MTVEIPDFIARAIEAQGKTTVDVVARQAARLDEDELARQEHTRGERWKQRLAVGEPSIEEALKRPELVEQYVTPYGALK